MSYVTWGHVHVTSQSWLHSQLRQFGSGVLTSSVTLAPPFIFFFSCIDNSINTHYTRLVKLFSFNFGLCENYFMKIFFLKIHQTKKKAELSCTKGCHTPKFVYVIPWLAVQFGVNCRSKVCNFMRWSQVKLLTLQV